MTSIRRALLLPLAGGLALALVVATVATYLRARDEAGALFDVQLTQLAASVTGMPLAATAVPRGGNADSPLVVQVWNRDGVQVYRSQGGREAPARAGSGLSPRSKRATARGASTACSPAASWSRWRSRCRCATSSPRASRCAPSCRGWSRHPS